MYYENSISCTREIYKMKRKLYTRKDLHTVIFKNSVLHGVILVPSAKDSTFALVECTSVVVQYGAETKPEMLVTVPQLMELVLLEPMKIPPPGTIAAAVNLSGLYWSDWPAYIVI